MKVDPNNIILHQVAEKEVQQCQEHGDAVDIIRAEGNNSQTSFPTYSAINMYSPNTPTFPSPRPLPPQGSAQPRGSAPSKGRPT